MLQILDLALYLGGNAFEGYESVMDAIHHHGFHPIGVFFLIFGLQLAITDFFKEEFKQCPHGTASMLEGLCLIGFLLHAKMPWLLKGLAILVIGIFLLVKKKIPTHK